MAAICRASRTVRRGVIVTLLFRQRADILAEMAESRNIVIMRVFGGVSGENITGGPVQRLESLSPRMNSLITSHPMNIIESGK